jgi:hypothetical protein
MPSAHMCRPGLLAEELEGWALKREKILELLDIRGARTARRLAHRCRVLAEMEGAELLGDSWTEEWTRVREASSALLDQQQPNVEVLVEDAPSSERVTRVVEWEAPIVEKATRVVDIRALGLDEERLARFAMLTFPPAASGS